MCKGIADAMRRDNAAPSFFGLGVFVIRFGMWRLVAFYALMDRQGSGAVEGLWSDRRGVNRVSWVELEVAIMRAL